ncbi:LysR family transcriptional regulator [Chitinimonas lacunae]|uniref:LysR substrate-binding domain-containing protein n=1 Tax=Chitinimonas lacunae TaxID=1963018 RepID=A0ABV8MUK4_9NEIS
MLELDPMAIFAEVADCGSFTAAARRLGLPKSTVSQRVSQLEDRLGVRLLQRTTRRLGLTSAGQLYLGHCLRMLDAARAAEAAVSLLREAPAGRLRLTAPEASGTLLFPALLAVFCQQYPAVEIDLVVSDTQLDLVAERIDLAFRTGRLDDSSLICRRIGPVRRALVASPGYLDRCGRPEHPAHLPLHRCLLHHPLPQWPLGNLDPIEPPPALSSNSLAFLRQAALADAGIALLPVFTCRDDLAAGRLETVLPAFPPRPNDYFAIYPSRAHPTAALTAFLRFIDEQGLARQLAS